MLLSKATTERMEQEANGFIATANRIVFVEYDSQHEPTDLAEVPFDGKLPMNLEIPVRCEGFEFRRGDEVMAHQHFGCWREPGDRLSVHPARLVAGTH